MIAFAFGLCERVTRLELYIFQFRNKRGSEDDTLTHTQLEDLLSAEFGARLGTSACFSQSPSRNGAVTYLALPYCPQSM